MKAYGAIVLGVFAIILSPISAHGASLRLFPSNAYPGETVIVLIGRSEAPAKVVYGEEAVPTFAYGSEYRALIPLPVGHATGRRIVRVVYADGTEESAAFTVRAGVAKKIDLPIPKQLGLTPQALTQKLADTKQSLTQEVFASSSPQPLFAKPFGLALYDNRKISSRFGELRNSGGTLIRHLGVDFDAKRGAPVAAINTGTVRKAYLDEVYGNSVIVDHGAGVFSMYLHLDTMRVVPGEAVRRGQVVGTVGTTGYSSAPHLHLSVRVRSVPVDPLSFVRNFR